MYYPLAAVSLAALPGPPLPPALRPPASLLRRHRSSPAPAWGRTTRSAAAAAATPYEGDGDDGLFTLDLEPDDGGSPWEGAVVYRRDAAVQHVEYGTTLERLGLEGLSSPESRARAAAMGLGSADSPVLVSLDVTRRRGRLRLDGIVRTVITLGCFRCADPAPQGVFANFSLLLTEDPVEEPDIVDLGTIYEEEEEERGPCAPGQDDDDIDWDDRLHFPPAHKEIDISKHIRDIIHLEITLDAVCSPTCKGLCLACGANLNATSCSCSCSSRSRREQPQEPNHVQQRGPLKELLKPMHKR